MIHYGIKQVNVLMSESLNHSFSFILLLILLLANK